MGNLSFENNKELKPYNFDHDQKTPLLYRAVIRIGFAKNEEKARKILIYIIVICLVFAIGLFGLKSRTPKIKTIYLKARPVLQNSTVTVPAPKSDNTSDIKK